MKKWTIALCVFMICMLLAACGGTGQGNHKTHNMDSGKKSEGASSMTKAKPVTVELLDAKGKKAGKATLEQAAEGVKVNVEATGLTPGEHGIHFHEKGVCEAPKFESAGKHFNPTSKMHGFKNPKGPHVGDLKNIKADSSGKATGDLMSSLVTLQEGKSNSLLKEGGTALVVHAKADDYKTDPTGNSGDRVLCGVIRK
ncbi:superoxide dismutase family protein [Fictibacillus sp. KU28468]|uniref:superoxide dismutase family protein n=1 Tax=Fictibacillus sp. KU28468 TaxID=2991053 RepID=UPI00223CA086|nr:superoxide dismutase family protein [Fictibacillus sp. KU28468]UZJ79965.1 superoxide dismutase family protein [Fictibacillus sp. KU28468]